LSGRLTVISGGPGTGKTTTVARILALMIEQAGGNALHIALAAPTGKAAARLGQSIRQSVVQLSLSETVRVRLPDKVQTLHRLLGLLPQSQQFRHNRHNPLSCDVLVVDEVSMVDLPLMAKLLQALPGHCRLIMLGDQDQLASVEAARCWPTSATTGSALLFKTVLRTVETVWRTCRGRRSTERPGPSAVGGLRDHAQQKLSFWGESGIGQLSRKSMPVRRKRPLRYCPGSRPQTSAGENCR
jgi:exodeoxyribonuclease V alpha subunit